MIISDTFTADDIRRIVERDDIESTEWYAKKASAVVRASIKATKFPFFVNCVYTSKDKNKYILFFYVSGKRRFTNAVLLKGVGEKGVCYYDVRHSDLKKRSYLHAYTAHFFKRFRERMSIDKRDEDLVMEYFNRNNINVLIYKDDEAHRAVYATNDGVSLISKDDRRHLAWFNTFVSNDMLLKKQKLAKDKVVDIIDKMDASFSLGEEEWNAKKVLHSLAIKSVFEEVNQIYKTFVYGKNI